MGHVFSGDRCRHRGNPGPDSGRNRGDRRLGHRGTRALCVARNRVGGAGARGLVARGGDRGAPGARRGGHRRGGGRVRRLFGADARRRNARRGRCRGAAGADLVRREDGGAVPRLHRAGGGRAADPADVQPRAPQFHPDQIPLGAGAGAGKLEPRPLGHAPEGLCPLPPDGGAGDRCRGRLRDASARRGRARLVARGSGRGGDGCGAPSRTL